MKRYLLAAILLMATTLAWAAKAPTAEQLKDFCRNAGTAIASCETAQERQAAFDKVTAAFAKTADITRIAPELVDLLFDNGGTTLDPHLRLWLEPTLRQRAKQETLFAFYLWKYLPQNDGFMHGTEETAAFISFLAAKDLQKVVGDRADIVTEVFNAMSTMKDANWHTPGFAEGMLRLMQCNLPDQPTMDCVKVFNSIARVDTIDAQLREQFRTICRDKYAALATTLESPRKQKACQEQIKYLDGPFACGTLVGGKAPELHLMRVMRHGKVAAAADNAAAASATPTSTAAASAAPAAADTSLTILNDLTLDAFRGKVVLLDFWGTKCVPCLKSFPELAEIQQHFEGKDVVILGVTSLQGYFVDTPNHRTIQCRNDKDKELSLFPDYMKAMGITWTIAISQEDVMNTDYGALAIPHVVVIDKQGIVRHNAVNGDKETKIALIEALLGE